VIDLVWYYWIS